MSITAFSVMIAIFWCNAYVMLLALLRKRDHFILHFSFFPLILLVSVCIFRILFPLDFPYTVVLQSKQVMPTVWNFFQDPIFRMAENSFSLSLLDILLILWWSGSLFIILRFAIESMRFHKAMSQIPQTQDPKICSCMRKIEQNSNSTITTKMIRSSAITIPCMTGYFRRCV